MSNAKRITELDELTTLSGGEYVIVDHPTNGTKKYQLSNIGGGSGGGSSIEIDTTLTQSGKAADAKAAGDAIANKVDKVSGKGLSTNDYTDEDKATLDGMSSDVEDVVDQIDALFATDALKGVLDKKGTVSNGVTFTYDRTTNRYYAVGTANRNGIYRLANNVPLPSALQPGHTYTADWQRSQAKLYVVISFDGGSSFVIDTSVSSKLTFTVPESATTMLVEIRTTWNATVDDWCSISITGDGSFISRVNEMGSSINALKGDNFPGYYADQMDEAIERIQSNIEQFGHFGDSFVFFTDAHWGLNQKHSPQLIKHILAKTNVRNVLFGGDALDSGSKISEISKGRDFMEAFDFVPGGLKFCIGNHDSNRIGHGSDSSYWMTANQCYGIFGAAANQEAKEVSCPVSNYPNFYYYFDVPATNMR